MTARGWLMAALVWSFAVVASAPAMGEVVSRLRDLAQGHYALMLTIVVTMAAATILGGAALVIRDRRLERYGWIAAALLLAAGYGFVVRTGVADSDAAERFHFVQYGVLAFLFYKAWRPLGDGAVFILPLLACVIVGTVDEWVQWFVPGRVGEAKDALLNLMAGVAGTMFAIGVDPPPRGVRSLSSSSRHRVGIACAILFMVFGGFFHSVHLGHQIVDSAAGVFYSRYDEDTLLAVSAARRAQWRSAPPLTWSRYSREDQYLAEGIAHVRRRNQRWDEGHLLAARQENLILEKYYAPVLDTPSYIAATPHRWSDAQRASADAVPGPGFMIYESDALDYLVVTWPPTLYWLTLATAVLLTLRRTL
jgi:hypothetical protein